MRKMLPSLLLFSLIATLSLAAHAADAIDVDSICKRAKAVRLPAPDPAAKAGKDCDSQALYYGIGRAADPAAARACALSHLGTDDPMEGPSTLVTIYANGKGVPRNYDIAIAYACRMGTAAAAEMEGRLKHLMALKAKGPDKAPFDICDDVTSGMMMGTCAQRDSDLEEVKRNGKLDALTRNMGEGHKVAFAKLRKMEAGYATAVSDNAVDLSGTARNEFAVAARDAHHDAFVSTVQAALEDELAAASPADLVQADKALNAIYAKVMAASDTSTWGTVDKAGIKATQRTWIAYRDAFTAFAKGGTTSELTVARVLTQQRTKDLAAFLE